MQYFLDSFIELIPGKRGYGANHYICFKRINQVWLCFDDTVVRKAYLGETFRVMLAFYRNISSTKPIMYQFNLAQFKQMPKPRAKMSVVASGRKSQKTPIPPKGAGRGVSTASENITPKPASSKSDPGPSVDNHSKGETEQDPTNESQNPEEGTEVPNTCDPSVSASQTEKSDENNNVIATATDDTVESKPVLVGHVELTSAEQFWQEMEDKKIRPRLLAVRIKRYPNLLKRYQEGNVTELKVRPQIQRLSKIHKKLANKEQVLNLDFLAHMAEFQESKSVEVVLGDAGYQTVQPRKNPVESDMDDDEKAGSTTEPYINTSSSADDDDDDGGLWQQSQEQLSRVQGTCVCTALNGLHCRHQRVLVYF